jgi:PPOX class probable F420-dependent enzyme
MSSPDALPDPLVALLRAPSPCFIATVEPDGAPQLTQTWIDTDGTHLLLNTVEGHRKLANIKRDPRVVVNVCDRADLSRYWNLRGHVVDTASDGAADHIEQLSQRYTGGPYRNYGGRNGGRVLVRIAVDRIVQQPW